MNSKKYNYSGELKPIPEEKKYSAQEAQEFWKNPVTSEKKEVEKNSPKDYLSFNDKRSPVLHQIIERFLDNKNSKILELGPNAGRNLNYLYQKGYQNVHGIEINPNAVALLAEAFPEISKNITLSSLEDSLPKLSDNSYDLVFSMAVLEHISTDSDFIFDEIKRISSSYIITIEDEVTSWSERHFQRNYKEVFESNEWKEIFSANCEEYDCLDDRFFIRVFKRD